MDTGGKMIVLSKNKLLFAGAVLCAALLFAAVFSRLPQETQADYRYTVVLDAGHGGVDGGVVGGVTKIKESDLNLSMVYFLKEEFERGGFKVVLTRTDKNGLYGSAATNFKKRDMQRRKEIIEECAADMVLSIHMNQFSLSSRKGPQVFYDAESSEGKGLAESIQKTLNAFTGLEHSALSGEYFMLQCTRNPSVIVECGFLSNPEDEQKLIDTTYQSQLAHKIYQGALSYLSYTGADVYGVS